MFFQINLHGDFAAFSSVTNWIPFMVYVLKLIRKNTFALGQIEQTHGPNQ